MRPSHVLVPLDGSPLAESALTHAFETYECEITVLNVVTPIGSSMIEGGIREEDDDRRAEAEARAKDLVEGARKRADDEGGKTVQTAIATGDPGERILAYVADHDVDHVVMGGHGGDIDGLVTRLLGTVATTVVSEAPCSVTVIR